MRKALIDTGIYALAMKGDPAVARTLRRIDRIGITATSVSELLAAFKGLPGEDNHRRELDDFLDAPRVAVHAIDVETADFFASLRHNVGSTDSSLPSSVIWLAAVALRHGYKIYSKDSAFDRIPGLVRL